MTAQLKTISFVSSKLGTAASVIKKWEEEFALFLEVPRNEKNARTYTNADIETLKKIKNMKEKNVDNKTIHKLLTLQGLEHKLNTSTNSENVSGKIHQYSSELTADMIGSLNKLLAFAESEEVKDLLSIESKLSEIEKNIVQQVKTAIHEEVAAASEAQVEINAIEFGNLSERLTDIKETTVIERELLQNEIAEERNLLQRSIEEREIEFISLVQEKFRKEEEELKKDNKWNLSFLKQFIGFAK